MKTIKATLVAVLLIFVSMPGTNLLAQRSFAIGINGGSTGAGINGVFRLTDKLNARVGYHTASYSETGVNNDLDDEVGLDYSAGIDVSSFSLMLDFFPFKRFLKISAGLYSLDWNLDAGVVPNSSYTLEGREFSPERLGRLDANIAYADGIAPYVGIGFGNAVAKGLPIKFNIDLGMINTGAPTITMTGEGLIGPTADNATDFQTGLNEFEWYPVINVGISIAFMNVYQGDK